jgi:hypothetical protein
MKKELVVAFYDKDVSWVENISKDILVKIYQKGGVQYSDDDIVLPNIGREIHSYFYHIVTNYNNLADHTFFSQDHPFDHFENIIKVVNGVENIWNKESSQHFEEFWGFHWNSIGTMWNLHDSTQFGGKVLTSNEHGSPHPVKLPMVEAWHIIFEEAVPPQIFEFTPGAHFAVSRNQIHTKPLKYYQNVLKYLEDDELSPWTLERLIAYIFKSDTK